MTRLIYILFAGAALTAFAATASAADFSEAAAAPSVQTNENAKTIVLSSPGENKIQVIKIVREYLGIGLKEAHELVSNTPSVIKKDVPVKEAEELAKRLTDAGATVELK